MRCCVFSTYIIQKLRHFIIERVCGLEDVGDGRKGF